MKRSLKLIALGLLVLPLTVCSLSGGPIDGVVLDESTNKPIAGAFVAIKWKGDVSKIVESSTWCYHSATTQTDANGKYHIPFWTKGLSFDGFRTSNKVVYFNAFKPGYIGGGDISPKDDIILLRPFKGSKDEYFDHLDTLSIRSFCAKQLGIISFPFFSALLNELKEKGPETAKQRMILENLERRVDWQSRY